MSASQWIAGIALAGAAASYLYARHQRGECALIALQSDSVAAAQDTTRSYLLGMLHLWERRAIQTRLERDELDKLLKGTSAVRAGLELQIRELQAQVHSQPMVQEPNDVRFAHFAIRQMPFTVAADITLPPPPRIAGMDLSVRLDPAHLAARITCGQESHGVAPASLDLTAPSWLTVTLDSLAFEPRVCSPIAVNVAAAGALRTPWWTNVLAVLAGYVGGRLKL